MLLVPVRSLSTSPFSGGDVGGALPRRGASAASKAGSPRRGRSPFSVRQRACSAERRLDGVSGRSVRRRQRAAACSFFAPARGRGGHTVADPGAPHDVLSAVSQTLAELSMSAMESDSDHEAAPGLMIPDTAGGAVSSPLSTPAESCFCGQDDCDVGDGPLAAAAAFCAALPVGALRRVSRSPSAIQTPELMPTSPRSSSVRSSVSSHRSSDASVASLQMGRAQGAVTRFVGVLKNTTPDEPDTPRKRRGWKALTEPKRRRRLIQLAQPTPEPRPTRLTTTMKTVKALVAVRRAVQPGSPRSRLKLPDLEPMMHSLKEVATLFTDISQHTRLLNGKGSGGEVLSVKEGVRLRLLRELQERHEQDEEDENCAAAAPRRRRHAPEAAAQPQQLLEIDPVTVSPEDASPLLPKSEAADSPRSRRVTVTSFRKSRNSDAFRGAVATSAAVDQLPEERPGNRLGNLVFSMSERRQSRALALRVDREVNELSTRLEAHHERESRRSLAALSRDKPRALRAHNMLLGLWSLALASLPASHFAGIMSVALARRRLKACLGPIVALGVFRRILRRRQHEMRRQAGHVPPPREMHLARIPCFATWPSDVLQELAALTAVRCYGAGTVLCWQDEPCGILHIIAKGEVSVQSAGVMAGGPAAGAEVRRLLPGDAFATSAATGVVAPAPAVHVVAPGCRLLVCHTVSSQYVARVAERLSGSKREATVQAVLRWRCDHLRIGAPLSVAHLRTHPALAKWPSAQLRALVATASPVCLRKGARIFSAGDDTRGVYVIGRGCAAGRDSGGVPRSTFGPGAVVGLEENLVKDAPRQSGVDVRAEVDAWLLPSSVVQSALQELQATPAGQQVLAESRSVARESLLSAAAKLPVGAVKKLSPPRTLSTAGAQAWAQQVCSAAEPAVLEPLEILCEKGDPVTHVWYIGTGTVCDAERGAGSALSSGQWLGESEGTTAPASEGRRRQSSSEDTRCWRATLRATRFTAAWRVPVAVVCPPD